MHDIDVLQKNAVWLNIDCERDTALELQDYFSYYVPNYRFMEKYKSGMWDGKIRLFNIRSGSLYFGLLPHLVKFAKERNYSVRFHLNKFHYNLPDFDQINHELDSLSLSSGGKSIKFRSYQKQIISHCLSKGHSTVLSPTASGKSAIIYGIIRRMDAEKILLVVPRISLVEQMYSDFEDYSSNDSWNVEDNCYMIMGGNDKDSDKKIYISTWQSIYKQPKQYFEKFDALLIDEAHEAKAASLTNIGEKCVNAYYRFGFTGTLDDVKTHILTIQGLLGRVYKGKTSKELQEAGYLADLEIKCIVLKHDQKVGKALKKKDPDKAKNNIYAKEIDYICGNKNRNKFIAHLANKLEGNTLILFQRVDKHGKMLYNILNDVVEDREMHYIHGGIPVDKREKIRQSVNKSNSSIICASYGTFSTGVNIPNIRNIIFASPYKSKIKVLQSIGRGLRVSDDGSATRLYDIVDSICYKRWKNYSFKHFIDRLEIYRKEKFKFIIKEIDFK